MPKISIITTTYNHEQFIASAIESVLEQSFDDWELLIWDDASIDRTYDIIQTYTQKDVRIQSWKHEKNLWIVGNMNFLISKISNTSHYVTFLEWDDIYLQENLSNKVNIFDTNPNISFFYSHWNRVNQIWEQKIFKSKKESQIEHYTLESLLNYWNPIQSFWVVAIRKELLQKYLPICTPSGGIEWMFGPLDYWLWVQMIPNIGVYYSKIPLFGYRIHSNNFVKNITVMNNQFEEIYLKIIKDNSDKKIKKIAWKFILSNRVVSAFFSYNRIDVWKYSVQCISYWWDRRTLLLFLLSFFPWIIIKYLYNFKKKYV